MAFNTGWVQAPNPEHSLSEMRAPNFPIFLGLMLGGGRMTDAGWESVSDARWGLRLS